MIPAWTGPDKFHPKPSEDVFSTVFPYNNLRPDADNDVISGMAIDNVGMDVLIKLGNSRSNGFLDIRGADFMSNEQTNEQDEAYLNSATRYRLGKMQDACNANVAYLGVTPYYWRFRVLKKVK